MSLERTFTAFVRNVMLLSLKITSTVPNNIGCIAKSSRCVANNRTHDVI